MELRRSGIWFVGGVDDAIVCVLRLSTPNAPKCIVSYGIVSSLCLVPISWLDPTLVQGERDDDLSCLLSLRLYQDGCLGCCT